MRKLIIVLAILAFAFSVASAKYDVYKPRQVTQQESRVWGICFFDDLEDGAPGWTHGDYTATAVPHFHVDSYLAYAGQYSWWCGSFAYDADGGYGNNWDDRLTCPSTAWTGYTYPVLTFAFRGDSEPGYDYTYVDAESSGVYVHLNRGYDGPHAWGTAGFYLGNMDDPAECRFRFVSDGAWSDGDGLYMSDAGAFMCDDVMIWDYTTGTTLFYDDVETGGLCTPGTPPSAGDYWHLVQDDCLAFSDPTVWVNTQQPDENYIPPGVQNWLRSPEVCIRSATTCTTYFILQFFTPNLTPQDYWTESVVIDGVTTELHGWVGDQCESGYGECDHFLGGDDISALLPGDFVYHEWAFYSSDDGCGPDVCNHAGITIDDFAVFVKPAGPSGGLPLVWRTRSAVRPAVRP
jgi:hypothetical protein